MCVIALMISNSHTEEEVSQKYTESILLSIFTDGFIVSYIWMYMCLGVKALVLM